MSCVSRQGRRLIRPALRPTRRRNIPDGIATNLEHYGVDVGEGSARPDVSVLVDDGIYDSSRR